MRVLFITHYGELYGANLSFLNMILTLRDAHDIDAFVLCNKKGQFVEKLEEFKINYKICRYGKCTINGKKRFILVKRIIKKMTRLVEYLQVFLKLKKEKPFDIIHSNSSTIDIGNYLSKKMGCSHVWHIREFGIEDYDAIPIDSIKQVQKKYMRCEWLIAISDSIRASIATVAPHANIIRIYNGIEIPPKYEKHFKKNGKVNFALVGVIRKNKNQIDAVKAAAILQSEGIDNFCIHIIGGGTEQDIANLKNEISKMGLKEKIALVGYKSNVNEILESMDVGIITSQKEAFGRVTIEYMANYMPVVGSASGGTLELIDDGKDGFLYQVQNEIQLASKMKILIDNEERIREMGLKARKKAEKFTVYENAKKVNEVYKKICKE